MRIVFMGTPDFAVGALQALVDAGHELLLVVTQPDKERGRGKSVSFCPVKVKATELNIPVFQPRKLRDQESVDYLKTIEADVFVVAAFGQILPKVVLDMPKYGCLNIHASLLPKYRGAAPIQWSILDGEKQTGVTIMQMNEGLDTGDILMQKVIDIDPKETGESLFDRLSVLGAEAIVEALNAIEAGGLTPVPQDDSQSTYARMLDKSLGEMDFTWDAQVLERYVRGLNSWPSAYTHLNGKSLKIWEAEVVDEIEGAPCGAPGEIVKVDKKTIFIQCKRGYLAVKELQLEGKKRMDTGAFLLGYDIQAGTRLG